MKDRNVRGIYFLKSATALCEKMLSFWPAHPFPSTPISSLDSWLGVGETSAVAKVENSIQNGEQKPLPQLRTDRKNWQVSSSFCSIWQTSEKFNGKNLEVRNP